MLSDILLYPFLLLMKQGIWDTHLFDRGVVLLLT